MGEWYPSDAALLALGRDEATGVEYIETGQSPYYLAFRRMLYRLLRACERANDLRVYQDGALSVGVRAGRAYVGDAAVTFEGAEAQAVEPGQTTWLWLDDGGALHVDDAGLPGDEPVLALARVEAGAEAIEQVVDLRGEAFLRVASLAGLGVKATAGQINAALEEAGPAVTAEALNALCAGATSVADVFHGHRQFFYDEDDEAHLRLINDSAGSSAGVGLQLSLPGHLGQEAHLLADASSGHLRQRYGAAGATAYALVGVLPMSWRHEGALTASASDRLIGAVPVSGVVEDVVLSVGENIESSSAGDGVEAVVKVNGVAVTTTHPKLTDADGGGFRSTAQGDGTAAVVADDGSEQVQRGDVVAVDVARDVTGSVSEEPRDVVVLLTVRADGPA